MCNLMVQKSNHNFDFVKEEIFAISFSTSDFKGSPLLLHMLHVYTLTSTKHAHTYVYL